MQSVTSETATNVSFPERSAGRASHDQSPGNDMFAGLVDSNTAADANTAAAQTPQPAAQHWSDNSPSASDRNSMEQFGAVESGRERAGEQQFEQPERQQRTGAGQ